MRATPLAIPGRIQAEDYDNGAQGVAYSDGSPQNEGGAYRPNEGVDVGTIPSGGFHVGWVSTSEWAEYTVNVAASGTYTVSARVATQTANGSSLRILFDGKKVGTLAVPNTGEWQTYATVSTQVKPGGWQARPPAAFW